MKLKEFLEQLAFCTKGMSEEEKAKMEVVVEIENVLVPRSISCIESTESTLYITSRAERRATT